MKKSLILILLVVLCYITALLLMSLVFTYVLDDEGGSFEMFVLYSGGFILTIGGLALFGRALKWYIPSARPRPEILDLPLIVLALISIIAIGIVVEPIINLLPESNLDALYDMMRGGLWAVITGVVAAPILEEVLFRGIIQSNIVNFTSPFAGIIMASLIFGLVHLIPQQVILATLSSLVIGTIYYLTRSLATVISIHMLNNGLAYTFTMYFGEHSSITELFGLTGISYGLFYGICLLFLCGMVFLAVVHVKKRFETYRLDSGVANAAQ